MEVVLNKSLELAETDDSLLHNKHELIKIIISKILSARKNAINKIIQNIRKLKVRKKAIKQYIILKLLDKRRKSLLMLQRTIKHYLTYKLVKSLTIKETDDYVKFVYGKPCTTAQVKIFDFHAFSPFKTDTSQVFDLKPCKLRKCLVTYIQKELLYKSKYNFYFIIDGIIVVSPDYIGEFNKEGEYHNTIIVPHVQVEELDGRGQRLNSYNGNGDFRKKKSKINSTVKLTSMAFNRNSGLSPIEDGEKKSLYKNSFNVYSTSSLATMNPKPALRKVDSNRDVSKRVVFNKKVEFQF